MLVRFDLVGGDAARLPEREVRGVSLLSLFGVAALGLQFLDVLIGEFAVVLEGGHIEVDRPVGLVGVALLDQCLDQIDDLGDVLGDAGVDLGTLEIQIAHVPDDVPDVGFGDVGLAVAVFADAGDDLLVDVGEVFDVVNVIAQPGEPAVHDVDVDPAACVTEMRWIRDGQPAVVEPNGVGIFGFEGFALAGQRVTHAECHCP